MQKKKKKITENSFHSIDDFSPLPSPSPRKEKIHEYYESRILRARIFLPRRFFRFLEIPPSVDTFFLPSNFFFLENGASTNLDSLENLSVLYVRTTREGWVRFVRGDKEKGGERRSKLAPLRSMFVRFSIFISRLNSICP